MFSCGLGGDDVFYEHFNPFADFGGVLVVAATFKKEKLLFYVVFAAHFGDGVFEVGAEFADVEAAAIVANVGVYGLGKFAGDDCLLASHCGLLSGGWDFVCPSFDKVTIARRLATVNTLSIKHVDNIAKQIPCRARQGLR